MELSKIKEINGASLAYLGDAIWEWKIREHFFNKNLLVDKLHKLSIKYVNAKCQSQIFEQEKGEIDEEAFKAAKRSKNTNIKSFPNSCSKEEYKNATAFEALVGYYYLTDQIEKIDSLIDKYILKSEG